MQSANALIESYSQNHLARLIDAVVRLCLCLLVALPAVSFAQNVVVTNSDHVSISRHLGFLDDPKSDLSFEQALVQEREGHFQNLPGTLGRGYTNATSWVTFKVENQTDSDFTRVIKLTPQMLDNVDLYVQVSKSQGIAADYRHFALGDHVPEADKHQIYPIMGVPIEIPSGESRRVFVRIKTTSSHLIGMELLPENDYVDNAILTLLWVSGYIAVAFVIAIITMLQAVRVKDLAYGVYGLVPLGLCLNVMGTEGLTAILFPAVAHSINDALVGLGNMLCLGGVALFAIAILKTRKYHPIAHWYLVAIVIVSVGVFLTSGTDAYKYFASPLMLLGMVMWLVLTWVGLKMVQRGDKRNGILLMAAFVLPLLGAAVGMSRYLGLLPQNEFTQYIVPVTSMGFLFLMSLVLSDRLSQAQTRLTEAAQRIRLDKKHQQELEKLLSMISHEIRNPIAVIDAATQSLQVLDTENNPERLTRLDKIRRSVNRLIRLMDLTDKSYLRESESMTLKKEPVDAFALTSEIVSLIDGAEESRITIKSEPTLANLVADKEMLRFAWLNLIDNACKYSPKASTVEIKLAASNRSGQQGITWSVKNDGNVIPSALIQKIFDKYQRGPDYDNTPGLGLGLYLAKYIVEKHQGTLVAVPCTKGALFECWLPCNPDEMMS